MKQFGGRCQANYLELVGRYAYRDINGADGARILVKTGPFLVLLKSNGRLQATWHGKAASY